jgi:hypothetical protein
VAVTVELLGTVDLRSERVEHLAPPHPVPERLQIVPQQLEIVHDQNLGKPSASETKPQFGSTRMRKKIVFPVGRVT